LSKEKQIEEEISSDPSSICTDDDYEFKDIKGEKQLKESTFKKGSTQGGPSWFKQPTSVSASPNKDAKSPSKTDNWFSKPKNAPVVQSSWTNFKPKKDLSTNPDFVIV
jgi:hypothetical protein